MRKWDLLSFLQKYAIFTTILLIRYNFFAFLYAQFYNQMFAGKEKTIHTLSHISQIQFQSRLLHSPILSNPYYLGLQLINIVSAPCDRIQYIRTLIKCGVDVNFKTSCNHLLKNSAEGVSVLMIACQKSVASNVKQLLKEEKLDVGCCDTQGQTALHYALRNQSQNQSIQIFKSILKQFPHLLNVGPKPFICSVIDSKKLKTLQFFIKSSLIDPNTQIEPIGFTLIQYCISQIGQIATNILKQLIRVLLKYGGDPEKQNYCSQNSFDMAQKYLFDLQEIIEQSKCREQSSNNKFFLSLQSKNTYQDSKASCCKDEEYFQQSYFEMEEKKGHKVKGNTYCFDQAAGEISHYGKTSMFDEENCCEKIYKDQLIENKPHELQSNISEQSSQTNSQDLQDFHESVKEQLLSLQIQCQKQIDSAVEDIAPLHTFLTQIGNDFDLKLEAIGSFATGLWTPESDIDFVFINEKNTYVDIYKILKRIFDQLWEERGNWQDEYEPKNRKKMQEGGYRKKKNKLGITDLFLNTETKFPNIKMKLDEQRNQRKVEIGIFQRKCTGRKYVNFIREWVSYYPIIAPVFFAIRKILQAHNLHKPTKNGLKTYTIFLMILHYIQIDPNFSESVYNYFDPYSKLPTLFLSLIQYYSNQQYYQYYIDETKKHKPIFNMIDPLNLQNNTGGRDTDTEKVIMMFKSLGYLTKIAASEGKFQTLLSQLLQSNRMFQ